MHMAEKPGISRNMASVQKKLGVRRLVKELIVCTTSFGSVLFLEPCMYYTWLAVYTPRCGLLLETKLFAPRQATRADDARKTTPESILTRNLSLKLFCINPKPLPILKKLAHEGIMKSARLSCTDKKLKGKKKFSNRDGHHGSREETKRKQSDRDTERGGERGREGGRQGGWREGDGKKGQEEHPTDYHPVRRCECDDELAANLKLGILFSSLPRKTLPGKRLAPGIVF